MAVVLALLLASDGATTQARDRVWSVDGAVRIGSANDLDQALTAVGQVVILPNGDLAVGQPQDHTVLVFNSQGRRIRAIGRKGEGPGEFKVLSGIGLLRDTLYASDDALRRVSYFTPDGRFTRSVIWHSLPGRRQDVIYGLRAPQILLPDGSALLEPFSLGVPFPEYELYSLLPDGGGVVVVKRPLARGRGAAAFHVRKIGPSGDTAFSRSYAYTPKPLRPSDVTGIARALHERFQKRRENPAYRDVPPPGVRGSRVRCGTTESPLRSFRSPIWHPGRMERSGSNGKRYRIRPRRGRCSGPVVTSSAQSRCRVTSGSLRHGETSLSSWNRTRSMFRISCATACAGERLHAVSRASGHASHRWPQRMRCAFHADSSSAAPRAASPLDNVSAAQLNAMRKCPGASKNAPGTTAVWCRSSRRSQKSRVSE